MSPNPNNSPVMRGTTGNQSKVPQKGTPRAGGQQSTVKNAALPLGVGTYTRPS